MTSNQQIVQQIVQQTESQQQNIMPPAKDVNDFRQ